MDNQFQQMQQPYQPYPPMEPQKKKPGFGKGMLLGGVLGAVALFIISVVGISAYTYISGRYIVLGGGVSTAKSSSDVLDSDTIAKVSEITSYIDAYYSLSDYTTEDLQDGLLHGLVSALGDQYSVYYNADEYAELLESNSGTFAGIGAVLTLDENERLCINKVYADTPSEKAGLLAEDYITKIDGTSSEGMTTSDAVALIRGEKDTDVVLTIERPSTGETFDVTVTRDYITVPSVAYNMLDGNIGYIQISEFQETTTDQFIAAYEDLEGQGMTSMIVDLRDNPGGLLNVVGDILDYILPEGTVVYTEDKYGNRTDITSDASCIDIPMVVLVNGNSASASEIFAGAIKDYEYGTLIGTNTFGKGIVQSIIGLSNGDGLKITTANYYTPNGNFIHGVGIAPDVELEYEFLGGEDDTYDQSLDNQLIYAQEYLLGNQ